MTALRLTRPLILASTLLILAAPAWALYKVVGPNGEITYTDRPPTDNSSKAQPLKAAVSGGSALDGLPYALQQVATRYPVTLYASSRCGPCDTARQLLLTRGIPFTEKLVDSNEDQRAFRALTGVEQLPALRIGSQQLTGFSSTDWQEYLTAAGYPQQSALPSNYKLPKATPMVATGANTSGNTGATPTPTEPTRANAPTPNKPADTGNAPPGFRF